MRNPTPAANGPSPVWAKLTQWVDAPWFWIAMFAFMGLVGLAVIGPKYARRQEGVERRFEARRDIALRRATGALPSDPSDDGQGLSAERATEADAEPPPHRLLIPLDPLMFLLAMALELSLGKLLWSDFSAAAASSHPSTQEHP
jgi:hypothetical protein